MELRVRLMAISAAFRWFVVAIATGARCLCCPIVPVIAIGMMVPRITRADAACKTFPADSADILKVLVERYSENRGKFRQFECHYRVIDGTATSLSDAMAGKLANTQTQFGTWVVRDDWQRHELQCERQQRPEYDPSLARNGNLLMSGGSCDSTKVLTDGGLGLRYTWALEMASVAPSVGQRPPIFYTPISMSDMGNNEQWGPDAPLRPVGGGTMTRRYGGKVVSDGRELESVFVGMEKDAQTFTGRHWLLDPQRGHFPVEMRYCSNNQREGLTKVTDLRQLENGGYFPFRSVSTGGPYANDVLSVTIIEVETLVLGTPPDSAFTVSLPPGTMIANPDTNRGSFTFKDANDINITQLQELHARTSPPQATPPVAVEPSRNEPPRQAPKPENNRPEVKANPFSWGLLAAGMVAVLLLAGLYWFNQNRNRT